MEESEKGNRSGGGSNEGSESGHKEETTAGASSDAVVVLLRWSVSRYVCTGASESVNVSGYGSHKLSTWWNKEAYIPRDSAYRLRNRSGKDRFVYGRFVRLRGRALDFPSAEELP